MATVLTYSFYGTPVRVVELNNQNYFVIRDICNILGFSNPNRELAIHTRNKPLYERISTPGGLQVVRLATMDDVMQLLAPNGGRKARRLSRWLTKNVYPHMFPENRMDDRRLRVIQNVVFNFLGMALAANLSASRKKVKPNANR